MEGLAPHHFAPMTERLTARFPRPEISNETQVNTVQATQNDTQQKVSGLNTPKVMDLELHPIDVAGKRSPSNLEKRMKQVETKIDL